MGPESFGYREVSTEEVSHRESIFDRKEIEAPSHYVSVYHETHRSSLSGIDEQGLKAGFEARNMQGRGAAIALNRKIDGCRPEKWIMKGLGHLSSSFAYPYLEYGHGCEGPGRVSVAFTFTKEARNVWAEGYEIFKEARPSYLEERGITSLDDYIEYEKAEINNKLVSDGEVLELKVDPATVYVGDADHYAFSINDERLSGLTEDEAAVRNAKIYWDQIMTLEDFARWYRKPEWLDDGSIKDPQQFRIEPDKDWYFHVVSEAPDNLPAIVRRPEILIPYDIPQEYIRVVPRSGIDISQV